MRLVSPEAHTVLLASYVSIYVPGTVNGNQPAPELQAKTARKVMTEMCKFFGGCTVSKAEGGYVLSTGELVIEPVVIVKSFGDYEQLEDRMEHVMALANEVAETMGQECVSVECNGELNLVSPLKAA